ncbi:MAG: class F sortase [Nitriliruptoraceae bacterium]
MNRLSLASMTVGAALLLGAPLAWQASQPSDEVGEVPNPSSSPDVADREVITAVPPDEEPSNPGGGSAGGDARATAREASPPQPPPAPEPPRGLRLPSLDVDAPVVDVGLEESGSMEIPDDITTVGWYELGVEPGAAAGTAVISGHVDSREQGRGALWDLRTMDVDDPIEVEHADGTVSEWRVVARRSYPKEELPIGDIFTRFGDPRLALITCDGEFDPVTRQYADNVVVYAVPAGN